MIIAVVVAFAAAVSIAWWAGGPSAEGQQVGAPVVVHARYSSDTGFDGELTLELETTGDVVGGLVVEVRGASDTPLVFDCPAVASAISCALAGELEPVDSNLRISLAAVSASGWRDGSVVASIPFVSIGPTVDRLTIEVVEAIGVDGDPLDAIASAAVVTAANGDVNCDGRTGVVDTLQIMRHRLGEIADAGACVAGVESIHARLGDVDADGVVDLRDALIIARCTVGLANELCEARHG